MITKSEPFTALTVTPDGVPIPKDRELERRVNEGIVIKTDQYNGARCPSYLLILATHCQSRSRRAEEGLELLHPEFLEVKKQFYPKNIQLKQETLRELQHDTETNFQTLKVVVWQICNEGCPHDLRF